MQYIPIGGIPERTYSEGFQEQLLQEEWTVNVLNATPETPSKAQIHSIYYSTAKEMEENPQLKDCTYDFKNVQSWKDVAIQGLVHAGWRPDCAKPQYRNVLKAVPPYDPRARLVFGTLEGMKDIPLGSDAGGSYGRWLRQEQEGLMITTGAFYEHNIGYSLA